MANEMRQVFGDMLLTEPVDESEDESALPSPESLRRKVPLKHGKLPNCVVEKAMEAHNDDVSQEMDLRSTKKSGILYVEDEIDRQWNPNFFVLTEQKLYYTDTFAPSVDLNQDEDEETPIQRSVDVHCLRTGYRSVPLKNSFSEDLKIASLLVHITSIVPPKIIHYHPLRSNSPTSEGSLMSIDTDAQTQIESQLETGSQDFR